MSVPFTSRRSRATLGVILIAFSAGMTLLRAHAATEPLATLDTVRRLHQDGRASASALANAEYHAAHAQRSHVTRWTVAGYALQGVGGALLGLALVLPWPRRRS